MVWHYGTDLIHSGMLAIKQGHDMACVGDNKFFIRFLWFYMSIYLSKLCICMCIVSTQWCNQDFFKTKTKTLISRPKLYNSFKTKTKPSVQDQDQDFASQDQDLFVMYTRGRSRSIFIFGRKRKSQRKWNSTYGRKQTKMKMVIHFWPKNENEGHQIILVFFFFSYIQSPSQPYNAPLIPGPVSPFCRWSLLTRFHFPHVQCIDTFVAFF